MKEHNFSSKTKAYEYQKEAVKRMSGNQPVALFDEQGLGKSKIVIDTLCSDIKSDILDGAIIVCKKTLLKTWENEIVKHSHLSFTNLTGEKTSRKRFFLTFSHFYLINYESLIQEEELIYSLMSIRRLALVLDESHKIKNPDSNITQVIFRIKNNSTKRIIISGTPIANKPEDLWAQFMFLDDGKLLGTSFTDFKKKYSIDLGMGKNEMNELNLDILRDKIANYSIRRTKKTAGLKLPTKTYIKEYVELSGKQKDYYEGLKNTLLLEIKDMDGKTISDNSENILKKLLRLTQIASNPRLIDTYCQEDPVKFIHLDELIKSIIEKNEKVIIWSSFVSNITELKKRYRNYKALTLYGEMKISDRNKVVEWFQNDSDYKILIANPSAAKEGLTLTSANNAIYIDRTFNSVDYLQSQDRIHRISQHKDCKIIILIAKNTIDEYIEEVLTKKKSIAEFVQGDADNINLPKELLTKEDLIKILG